MAKHTSWTLWSTLSAAWVGYFIWFIWTNHEHISGWGSHLLYAATAAVIIMPPIALAGLGVCASWMYRRIASPTRCAS